MNRTLKVSACIITYNQENFIRQSIEGALLQKVNFDYEIVIGEDNSTDRTREIVKEYKKKYPDIIKLILNDTNLGMNGNWVKTIQMCEGKYIALCEGDDYWTDPLKLQKQVDFLETHPDFSLCFHNMVLFREGENNLPVQLSNLNQKDVTSIQDLCKGNYIYTASCLFRNKLFDYFPEWYFKAPLSDWPLHLLNSEFGKIKFISEAMGVYRIHGGGIWSKKKMEEIYMISADFVNVLNRHFKYKFKHEFNYQKAQSYYQILHIHKQRGNTFNFIKYILRCIVYVNDYDRYTLRDLAWHCKTFFYDNLTVK